MIDERISFSRAIALVERSVAALCAEEIATASANRRFLARPAIASRDCPPFDVSAMDGYCISASDLSGAARRTLKLGQPIFAGDTPDPILRGEARPIFTGGAIPRGAGAVLVQERAHVSDKRLCLTEDLPPGLNIRPAREDIQAGATVVGANRRLHPAMIGALCAYGIETVHVRSRPRVGLLVLGDEIAVTAQVGPGQIVDANGPMVAALLEDAGCDVTRHGQVCDDAHAIREAIGMIVGSRPDMILSTGGVSVGDRDLTRAALEGHGANVHFHGVHMRPGKPVLFATAAPGIPFFGLPGNPVAALVATRFFVMAALRRLYGLPAERPERSWDETIEEGPTRFLKASLRPTPGNDEVEILPGQKSHMLRPVLDAKGWLMKGGGQPDAFFPLFDGMS